MQSNKAAWAILPVVVGPVGVTLAKMHVIGPDPGTLFALGALASLTIGGIIWGVVEGARVAREGQQIRN